MQWTQELIRRGSTIISQLKTEGRIKIMGGIYDVENGKVGLLEIGEKNTAVPLMQYLEH